MGVSMRTLGLALLFSGLVLNAAHSTQSEGRRMLVFALYGTAGTPGSATTTTVIDFSTQVACREARDELHSNSKLKAPGFRVFATCVEP
jgi:hypothetical protein